MMNRSLSLRTSAADLKSRRKGRQQREAAEKGKTIGFYAKEIAKKMINPFDGQQNRRTKKRSAV